ncbi:MAG TPA: hypothetical protein VMU66_02715 [Gaiellales bacterium]|nr:hypothetical protein [Gaiellales bacterium]
MADDMIRVEIGFDGGLIISMKLSGAEWASLETAIGSAAGTVGVTSDDAGYLIDVSKISYVRRESHVGRVGF